MKDTSTSNWQLADSDSKTMRVARTSESKTVEKKVLAYFTTEFVASQ